MGAELLSCNILYLLWRRIRAGYMFAIAIILCISLSGCCMSQGNCLTDDVGRRRLEAANRFERDREFACAIDIYSRTIMDLSQGPDRDLQEALSCIRRKMAHCFYLWAKDDLSCEKDKAALSHATSGRVYGSAKAERLLNRLRRLLREEFKAQGQSESADKVIQTSVNGDLRRKLNAPSIRSSAGD